MSHFVDNRNLEQAAPYRTLSEYRDTSASNIAPITPAPARTLFGLAPRKPLLFLGGRVAITFGHHRHFFVDDDAA